RSIYFGVTFGGAKSVPKQNGALVSSSEVTDFARELGGRTRARTWDPMIKSHLLYQRRPSPSSGSHGRFVCPIGCLVVSARLTACCVNLIERESLMIAALSVACICNRIIY